MAGKIKVKTRKDCVKLELDGTVNIVEFKSGKRVATHAVDSRLVLDIVRLALTGGLDIMTKKRSK